jgi:hypothetical protein
MFSDAEDHVNRITVYSDPTATARNILAHESLFRFGFAAELITLVCDTTVALIFYDLLKPVRRVSLCLQHSSGSCWSPLWPSTH